MAPWSVEGFREVRMIELQDSFEGRELCAQARRWLIHRPRSAWVVWNFQARLLRTSASQSCFSTLILSGPV